MANTFIHLPTAAANGPGTAVDVSTMGATKTIVVEGNGTIFEPYVQIEISNDAAGAEWTPITRFQHAGSITIDVACHRMRATVQNYTQGGAPTVNAGAEDTGTTLVNLPVPANNGNGTPVDVSALGPFKSVQVTGSFKGTCIIQVSNDGGTSWAQADGYAFNTKGALVNGSLVGQQFRVKRSGIQPRETPGTPIVNIGAADTTGGGQGGIQLDNAGVAVTGGPFTTINLIGAMAVDGGSAVANVTVNGLGTTVISPAAITGAQNDYAPTGLAAAATGVAVRQGLTGAASLTGLTSGVAQRIVTIFNISTTQAQTITINHEDGASTAANRFSLPGSLNWIIPRGGSMTFWYDSASSRWRMLAFASSNFPAGVVANPGLVVGSDVDSGIYGGTNLGADGFAIATFPSSGFTTEEGFTAKKGNDLFRTQFTVGGITGAQNDYTFDGLIGSGACFRVPLGGAASITGLAGAQAQGRTILIVNVSTTNDLTLVNNSGASAVKFLLPNNADIVLKPNGSQMLIYDSTSACWRAA